MTEKESNLADLHIRLGRKSLNRAWAKIEILLGLGAAGIGLLLGIGALGRAGEEVRWSLVIAGWALFVGDYLALAGHRSHLYQSSNETTAYLVEELRQLKDKG